MGKNKSEWALLELIKRILLYTLFSLTFFSCSSLIAEKSPFSLSFFSLSLSFFATSSSSFHHHHPAKLKRETTKSDGKFNKSRFILFSSSNHFMLLLLAKNAHCLAVWIFPTLFLLYTSCDESFFIMGQVTSLHLVEVKQNHHHHHHHHPPDTEETFNDRSPPPLLHISASFSLSLFHFYSLCYYLEGRCVQAR